MLRHISQAVVYCLVRESPGMTAMGRIRSSFQRYCVAELDENSELRIVPLKGTVWQQSSVRYIIKARLNMQVS